jgi:hypothetical protein
VSSQDDQSRAIAERIARRLGGDSPRRASGSSMSDTQPKPPTEQPRARIIDFISPGPPVRVVPSVSNPAPTTNAPEPVRSGAPTEFFQFVPVTQSPWLGRLPSMLGGATQSAQTNAPPAQHSSEERFGVEEAAVAELVEFFESEKKCSMDPSGKPCDHCAMCSSRGF